MSYFWPLLPFPATSGATPASAPAPTNDSYEIIRKHFNAYLDGPNWQALIKAMADADELVWELAQNAFSQLFLSTASGKYLRRKAADSGIQEYPGLGMSDDKFRDLAIKLSTGRVTYISILEILESYYGSEALRAYADTQAGPFVLTNGQTLVFRLEGTEYVYEVNAEEFEFVGAAHPTELAVSLTNFFERKGVTARAVVRTDPSTGLSFVRVFSGAVGLRSNLAIVGGTAQPFIGFDTYKDVYTGTVTGADGYSWVYSLTPSGKTQIRFTHTVNSVIPKIDTATTKAGDYLVVGQDTVTAGWYTVESSVFEWVVGPLYRQTIVLTENIGYVGSIVQQSNSSYKFFAPTTHLVSNGNRTVVVSQSVPNVLDVRVPATASVDRTADTAAYIVGNTSVGITSIDRKNGVATVQTSTAHGLTTNRQVEIAGFVPAKGRSWVTLPNATNLGGSFVHAMSNTGNISGVATDGLACSPMLGKLSTGDIVIAGGYDCPAGAAYVRTFKFATAGTALGGASQATAARDTTYAFSVLGNLAVARWDAGSSMLSGPMIDQFLVTGGLNTAGTILSSAEKLTAGVWATRAAMGTARARHGQVTLNDGNVLVSGGQTSSYQSTASCELYQSLLNAWTPVASMNVARHGHKVHKLSDGKILAIGGTSMGQPTSTSLPGIVAQWRMNSIGGGVTPEERGLFPLTTTTPAPQTGKIDNCLVVTGVAGDAMTYVADATLLSTFRSTNQVGMTFEIWVKGFGTGNKSIAYYENTVAATNADAAVMRLYEGAPNVIHLETEKSIGVLGPGVTSPVLTDPTPHGGWYHIAVVCNVLPNLVDGVYSLYVNGELVGTSSNGQLPANATNSFLSIGRSPLSGNGWVGSIDESRLWNRPLTTSEVRERYLQGVGYSKFGTNAALDDTFQAAHYRSLNSVEIYDPALNTWTIAQAMADNRSLFESIELDNGDIMVLGGKGYPQSPRFPIAGDDNSWWTWPNINLSSVEIYTPSTGAWRRGPSVPSSMAHFWAAKAGSRVYVGSTAYGVDYDGVTATGSQFTPIYWLDLNTMKWGTLNTSVTLDVARNWAMGCVNDVVMLGGVKSGIPQKQYADVIIGDGTIGAAGGINGTHKVVSVISSTAFTIATEDRSYTSNLGFDGQQTFGGTTWDLTGYSGASRAANVTTVTATVPAGTLAVFINSNDANFSSGLKLLTQVTATTIKYAEVAANAIGNVYVGSPFVIPTSEAINATGTGGTFLIDATRWTQLSGESTSTVALTSGNAYSVVTVASTASFPDGNGYVVLGLGTALESKPLKYLEKISLTEFLMQGFTAEQNWPVGTTVTQITLDVTNDIASATWVTGALAAQLAAERDVRESVANDIDLNWSVIYPGDRGLGGEGAANSDAPTVWGPDAFDSGF